MDETTDKENLAHILIVDDEPGIRMPLVMQLRSKGYTVSEAGAVDEAMKVVVENTINLIISDIKMPGASGFDLLSLSKMYEEAIPIILMSGHVDEETMKRLGIEEGGAISVIEKPFSAKDLYERIEMALSDS